MFILLSSLSLDGKTIYSVAHSFKLGYYPWFLSLPSFPSNQTLSHDDSLSLELLNLTSPPLPQCYLVPGLHLLSPWSSQQCLKKPLCHHLALAIPHSSAIMIFLKCRLDPIIPVMKYFSYFPLLWRVGAWRWGVALESAEGRIWSLWRDGQVLEQRSQGDVHTWLSRCVVAHWIN